MTRRIRRVQPAEDSVPVSRQVERRVASAPVKAHMPAHSPRPASRVLRAGLAPVSRRSRAGPAPVSRRSRAGLAPVPRRSRAGLAPVSRRSRAGPAPVSRQVERHVASAPVKAHSMRLPNSGTHLLNSRREGRLSSTRTETSRGTVCHAAGASYRGWMWALTGADASGRSTRLETGTESSAGW